MRPLPVHPRILLLDPSPGGMGWLAEALAHRGHHHAVLASLEAVLRDLADPMAPRLLVARAAGPARSGLELLRRLRRASTIPCILLAGPADGLAERVAALELGADDCWPCGMARTEMLARLLAVLRRFGPRPSPATEPDAAAPAHPDPPPDEALPPALAGGWRLLPQRRTLVAADGQRAIRLTGAEFEFLRLLLAAGGEAVEREAISRRVFRRPWRVEDRAVDGLVKRLRRKLPEDAIATIRGVGYALAGGDGLPGQGREAVAAELRSIQPQVEICGAGAITSSRGLATCGSNARAGGTSPQRRPEEQ